MTRMRIPGELHRLTSAIRTLNTRWARRALSLWQGRPFAHGSPDQLYAGFEKLLTLETIAGASGIQDDQTGPASAMD
jgi:hypothetical protein